MKFSITIFFYKFIAESASEKKLSKSVNSWQNCRQEGGLHVDDREQMQFAVTLMTQIRIMDHSVGCAVCYESIIVN